MNHIWMCTIKLQRKNPRASSRHPFLYARLDCLVILDKDHNFVDNQTNRKVIGRNIEKKCGSKWEVDHIQFICIEKNVGTSKATF